MTTTTAQARGSTAEAFQRIGASRPWRLLRHNRLLVLSVACAASVVATADQWPIDIAPFAVAGARLWSAEAIDVFDNSWLQTGVAQLTLFHVLTSLERLVRFPTYQLTSIVVQGAVTFGTGALATLPYRIRARSVPADLPLCAGALALLLGLAPDMYTSGHPAGFAITGLWLLAGAAAVRDRAVAAGLLLAASTAFETWGVLGAPLLLLLPVWPSRLRAALTAGLTLLVLWGPFLVFGAFAMHHFDWIVQPHSVLAPVLGAGAAFGWPLRLLQGGAALGLGLLVTLAIPAARRSTGIWAVPMAVTAARLSVDPVGAPYYWTPVVLLTIVAAVSYLAERDAAGLLVLPLLYPALLESIVPEWARAVAVLAAVAVAVVLLRRERPPLLEGVNP